MSSRPSSGAVTNDWITRNRRSLADAHGQAVVKLAEAEAAEEARRICGNKKVRDQQGKTLQMRRDEETQLAEEMAASARSKGPCKRADASARDKGGQPGTGEDASLGAGEDASSGSRLRSRSKSSSTAMHVRAQRSQRRSPPSTSEPASSSGITLPKCTPRTAVSAKLKPKGGDGTCSCTCATDTGLIDLREDIPEVEMPLFKKCVCMTCGPAYVGCNVMCKLVVCSACRA